MNTMNTDLPELLAKHHPDDFARSLAKAVQQLNMETDVEGETGVERSEERTT